MQESELGTPWSKGESTNNTLLEWEVEFRNEKGETLVKADIVELKLMLDRIAHDDPEESIYLDRLHEQIKNRHNANLSFSQLYLLDRLIETYWQDFLKKTTGESQPAADST